MATLRISRAGLDENVLKLERGRRIPMQFSPPRKAQTFMAAPRKKLGRVQWESRDRREARNARRDSSETR